MGNSDVLLVALVALLVGLAVGKAWERYKLQDGRWVDRRRARESPHYMLGLNFLVANQIDPAIEELAKAAHGAGDPLEIHLILGNLYREKGQVGRAIQEHQALLQRPDLRKLEHANVLLCLGLDYRRGGFVDRALEAFTEVLRLDPENQYALSNLEKLYEDQHQWADAYATRQKLAARRGSGDAGQRITRSSRSSRTSSGRKRSKRRTTPRRRGGSTPRSSSTRATRPRISASATCGTTQGDVTGAIAGWERLIEQSPDRAYLAFSRLDGAYPKAGDATRFAALCRQLIAANAQDWRARLALARHLVEPRRRGRGARAALRGARSTIRTRSRCTRRSGRRCRAAPAAASGRSLRRSSPATRSSISIRTSACGAAIAARSCSGSARTATSGTRSSRSGSRRPQDTEATLTK